MERAGCFGKSGAGSHNIIDKYDIAAFDDMSPIGLNLHGASLVHRSFCEIENLMHDGCARPSESIWAHRAFDDTT